MKIVASEYSYDHEYSVNFQEIRVSSKGTKIKIHIESGRYAQSKNIKAVLSVFDDKNKMWNTVYEIGKSAMKTDCALRAKTDFYKRYGEHYLQPVEEFAPFFQEDINTLIKNAEMILDESFSVKSIKSGIKSKRRNAL